MFGAFVLLQRKSISKLQFLECAIPTPMTEEKAMPNNAAAPHFLVDAFIYLSLGRIQGEMKGKGVRGECDKGRWGATLSNDSIGDRPLPYDHPRYSCAKERRRGVHCVASILHISTL